MASELVINVTSMETRIALIENGIITELHIDRETEKGIVGNIFKGKIQRVLPGMQSAFVNIGLERSAFLYVDDVYNDKKEFDSIFVESNRQDEDPAINQCDNCSHSPSPPIEELLTDGQQIIVQVIKDPLGSKGARISSHISIPGHHLVFLPTSNNIGVSRKITDEEERERLHKIIQDIKPPDMGFIIRTASEGATENQLKTDMKFLIKLWENIQGKIQTAPVPSMLHEELSIPLRAIRDMYCKNVKKVVVDCKSTYEDIIYFIDTFLPQLKYSVELYEGLEPVFDAYGIEVDISRALGKRIWLKSGGYIVIEETEALVVIDVNTGRYVGKRNQADTILKTNLEAVKEIAYQIRLRNLGGIVIIDFIDMEKETDREMVLNSMNEALKKDRAKTNVVNMSDIGLVQMTRKRVTETLSGHLCEICPYCEGRGIIQSIASISYEMIRAISKESARTTDERIFAIAHPDVVDFLYNEEQFAIDRLEKTLKKKIILKPDNAFHHEKYTIFSH